MQLVQPPQSPRLGKLQTMSSSALPPIASTHSTKHNTTPSKSKMYKVNTLEEGTQGHRSNKKVTITASDSNPKLERGEQNKNGTVFKRVFNAIVRHLN